MRGLERKKGKEKMDEEEEKKGLRIGRWKGEGREEDQKRRGEEGEEGV